MQFKGRLRLPEEVHAGIPVELKLDDIFVVLKSESEILGEWRMDDVGITRVFSNQFLLDLEGEEMVFIADDPLGFAYDGMTTIDETSQRLSKRRRLRRKKARPGRETPVVVDSDRADAEKAKERRSRIEEPVVSASPVETTHAPVDEPADRPAAATTPTIESAPGAGQPLYEPHAEPMYEVPPPLGEPIRSASPPLHEPIREVAEPAWQVHDVQAEPEFEIEEVFASSTAAFVEQSADRDPQDAEATEVSIDEAVAQEEEDVLLIEEVAAVSSSADVAFVSVETHLPVREPVEASPEPVEEQAPVVEPVTLAPIPGADDRVDEDRAPVASTSLVPTPDPFAEAARADVAVTPAVGAGEERAAEAVAEVPPSRLASRVDSIRTAEAVDEGDPQAVERRPADRGAEDHGRTRFRRRRRQESGEHEHAYEQKSAVGGIIRRVCTECGHVSFGAEDVYEAWS